MFCRCLSICDLVKLLKLPIRDSTVPFQLIRPSPVPPIFFWPRKYFFLNFSDFLRFFENVGKSRVGRINWNGRVYLINYKFVWRDYDKLWQIPDFADVPILFWYLWLWRKKQHFNPQPLLMFSFAVFLCPINNCWLWRAPWLGNRAGWGNVLFAIGANNLL